MRIEIPTQAEMPVDPRQLYTSGLASTLLSGLLRGLPPYVDDIQRDYPDTYDRMCGDPAVAMCLGTLRDRILEHGPEISPASVPEGEELRSQQMAEFVRAAAPEHVLEGIAEALCEALAYGHRTVEVEWGDGEGELIARTVLRGFIDAPRANHALIVDQAGRLAGLIVKPIDGSPMPPAGTMINPASVLPLTPKFVYWAIRGDKAVDARGRSLLRPAYNPWWIKQHLWPSFMKYLGQFATPSVWVRMGEESSLPQVNERGEPVIGTQVPAASVAKTALEQFFRGGSFVILPKGAELGVIQASATTDLFSAGIDLLDRQITQAILRSSRSVLEAQHGSRADSQTGDSVVARMVKRLQGSLSEAITRFVLHPLIEINFGRSALRYCPKLQLSRPDPINFAETARGVAALSQAGLIHDSQVPGIDQMLGLPARDVDAWMADRDEERERHAMANAELRRIMNPVE